MSMNPIQQYLNDIGTARATRAGTAETSYYPALATLLNEIGKTLNPKVRCVIQLQNRGAGIPDGGMFTADQFKRKAVKDDTAANPLLVLPPSRGVIEIKAPSEDLQATIESEQVARYWRHYGLVLVTNYRSFALLGRNPAGEPSVLERFTLADTEAAFWKLVAHPQSACEIWGERFTEYLHRVMIHNAPLASPQDVAAILASYARDAKARIEHADLPALAGLRGALEQALGLHFEGEKGEHFFRSTLIQTLFYGVFSAWVLWARHNRAIPVTKDRSFKQALREASPTYSADPKRFDWHSAAWCLRVPMIRALFEQIATPARLGPLGLAEVLDWTGAALNRVDLAAFFTAFDEGHAVQYFYEPFLEAFDPELRKDLGVWYTPSEIVTYQVERVDTVLREELDIADGLADPCVIVLDPCCGTGAYVRAVLIRIAKTLEDRGGDALVAQDLKRAAIERVFGFEILPAPFVVAHLQISLLLETFGAPLNDAKEERVGVYLTNALTGWEPPKEKAKQIILLPELEQERDAANNVKQQKKIIVILGNPPYNAFAGVSPEEEENLVEAYKGVYFTKRERKRIGKDQSAELTPERNYLLSDPVAKGGWGIKKFNLDDLYVRFFRLAEKRIAEHSGMGVVSFISNFSYLGDPSFVVMRRRFLDGFNAMWFDCMNGDSRETGKRTPEGDPDPSVFSTEWNREGIRVGAAIGLMVKRGGKSESDRTADSKIRFRHFWGTQKHEDLLASLKVKKFDAQYETVAPTKENRWSFRPSEVSIAYLKWPRVTELCSIAPSNGLMEKRGGALMDDDREALTVKMRAYYDKTATWNDLKSSNHPLSKDAAGYNAQKSREKVLAAELFNLSRLRRYSLRPFENTWCYYSPVNPLWNRPRPTLWAQCWEGNSFLLTRFKCAKDDEGVPFFSTPLLSDDHFLAPDAVAIPVRLVTGGGGSVDVLPGMERAKVNSANLSLAARAYLTTLDLPDPDADIETAELIWRHALAIGYSHAYLTENADGIRQDWPRIPFPATKKALLESAALGRQVAALLDTETLVTGVTTGKIRDDLKTVAVFTRRDGKQVNPDAGDLDLTAGWGHAGKAGVTMPGRGKTGVNGDALDIYLNGQTYWRNVPVSVWEYTIGGYQVIKKWLSYREKPLLGRGLSIDEVRYVTETARRLAALVALQPALDANYKAVAEANFDLCSIKQH